MNSHLEEQMHQLFWMGERPDTPPDLARLIEQLREEWRAGSFDEPLFDSGDWDVHLPASGDGAAP